MTTLALLLLFPLCWPIVAKLLWKQQFTLPELAITLCIGVAVVSAGWALGRYSQMHDTEILNGQVTAKASKQVSCEHSYSCNCKETCSGSGDKRSCSTTCDTCYEHSYDVNWILSTDLEDIKIRRVSRRGLEEPPRFSVAQIGDPVAQGHSYSNYIKASPDSLFNTLSEKQALEKFGAKVPGYPLNIEDYHYLNRVIPVGMTVPDISNWNKSLALQLRKLGPAKQINLVVVLAKESDPEFARAIRAKWLGGKKNDVIVVLGTPNYPAIEWANVISWTDREVFKIQLADALQDLKTAEPQTVLSTIEQAVLKDFVRRPMADFEYLKELIEPPGWVVALLAILSMLVSVGTSIFLSKNNSSSFRHGYR